MTPEVAPASVASPRTAAAYPFAEIVPISAERGTNCERLLDLIVRALPERPAYFPPRRRSPTSRRRSASPSAIREKVFRLTHQEVPYACAVRVEELTERQRPECLYIRATIFVEQESQKGIVIGAGGAMLRSIGTAARRDLERFFGLKIYLELRVTVRKNWRKDDDGAPRVRLPPHVLTDRTAPWRSTGPTRS